MKRVVYSMQEKRIVAVAAKAFNMAKRDVGFVDELCTVLAESIDWICGFTQVVGLQAPQTPGNSVVTSMHAALVSSAWLFISHVIRWPQV
jgi:hypothetical protein